MVKAYDAVESTPKSTYLSSIQSRKLQNTKDSEEYKGCPIEIHLYDRWGDGWNNTRLTATNSKYIEGPAIPRKSGQKAVEGYTMPPGSTEGLAVIVINPDTEALLQVTTTVGSRSTESWEVLWSVQVQQKTYVLGFGSSIAIMCSLNMGGDEYLTTIKQLAGKITTTCSRCTYNLPEGQSTAVQATAHSNTDTPDPDPDPGSLSLDTRSLPYPVNMASTGMNGWYDDIFSSVYYTVSDTTRTKIITGGTYCSSRNEEICYAMLVDGTYIFRVTGNGYRKTNTNLITWRFCGITGRRQQEFRFAVSSGRCIPGDVKSVKMSPTMYNASYGSKFEFDTADTDMSSSERYVSSHEDHVYTTARVILLSTLSIIMTLLVITIAYLYRKFTTQTIEGCAPAMEECGIDTNREDKTTVGAVRRALPNITNFIKKKIRPANEFGSGSLGAVVGGSSGSLRSGSSVAGGSKYAFLSMTSDEESTRGWSERGDGEGGPSAPSTPGVDESSNTLLAYKDSINLTSGSPQKSEGETETAADESSSRLISLKHRSLLPLGADI